MNRVRRVLILCTGNSCRSQIAEGLVNNLLNDEWEAFSAGINPTRLNARAVQVMSESGIDISHQQSKSVDEFLDRDDLDLVVTVCDNAHEVCPTFNRPIPQIHMGFDDPTQYDHLPDAEALPKFRAIRDQIRQKLLSYLRSK